MDFTFVTTVIGWLGDILDFAMQPPIAYFIILALFGGAVGIVRGFLHR
jgi:hypothetical protein